MAMHSSAHRESQERLYDAAWGGPAPAWSPVCGSRHPRSTSVCGEPCCARAPRRSGATRTLNSAVSSPDCWPCPFNLEESLFILTGLCSGTSGCKAACGTFRVAEWRGCRGLQKGAKSLEGGRLARCLEGAPAWSAPSTDATGQLHYSSGLAKPGRVHAG